MVVNPTGLRDVHLRFGFLGRDFNNTNTIIIIIVIVKQNINNIHAQSGA